MIEKVELVNFISHKKTSIPLGEGITVFVGKNGAGKSSVIDGITYALYGEHARGDNVDLVRDRADSAEVVLEFSSGGRRYKAERKANSKGQLDKSLLVEIRDGSSAKPIVAGERKQFGESMSGEIAKILGLSYEQMTIAGIIQQGELDSIIELKPKDLKDLINSSIGIDRLDIAYDAMRDVTDSFRGAMRKRYGYDDQDVAKLARDASEAEAELHLNTLRFQSSKSDLSELRRREKLLEDDVARLEPLRMKAERLRIAFEGLVDYLREKRDGLAEELQNLEDVIAMSTAYLKLLPQEPKVAEDEQMAQEELKKCELHLNEMAGTVGALEAQKGRPTELGRIIEDCREALALFGRADEVNEAYVKSESKIAEIESEMAAIQSETGKLKANLSTAQKLVFKDHTCPICGSRVDKINELFDSDAIERHLSELQAKLGSLEEEKRNLNRTFREVQEEGVALARATRVLAEHRISGDGDVLRLQTEKEALASKIEDLPRLRKLQREAAKRKTEIESELSLLRREQQNILVAKAYLADHEIDSESKLREIITRREELSTAIRSIPEGLGKMTKYSDVHGLASLSMDEPSSRMVKNVEELARDSAKFDQAVYDENKASLEEMRRKEIPVKSGEVSKWQTEMERTETDLENLKETLAKLRGVSDFVEVLEKIRSKVYFRDGPVSKSVRSWALDQLSKKASEYARLFEIGVSSITITEKNRELSIECYGPRGHVKTTSMSGGEKVAIALALRFALAYVMGGYKLDFIILDEPTVHLDSERKRSLVDIVSRLGGEESPLKQIVIITHDSEIFENADVGQVWRFEMTSEGSRVSSGNVN
jgi:DNA repair protein SbcC/Rad50